MQSARVFRYGSLLLAILALVLLLWFVTHRQPVPNAPQPVENHVAELDNAVSTAPTDHTGAPAVDAVESSVVVDEMESKVTSTHTVHAGDEPQPLPSLTPTVLPTLSPTLPPTPTRIPTLTPTSLPTPMPTLTLTPIPPPTPTPATETRTIGSISSNDLGVTFVIAQAEIADVAYFSKGVKYVLNDGTGSITLLVWQNVVEEIPARYAFRPGTQVQVTGEIDEYQGDLEVVPRFPGDVEVLASAERLPIEERAVGSVTASDEGRVFAVEGTVIRTESQGWLKLWLKDDTGEILIFVPSRVVEYLPPGIAPGVSLWVTGEVDVYQGVLEIIPLAAADVEIR